MIIKHISLTNFRNYGRLELDVGPSSNIIYGNNAQGKTNLIEAINICSCLSSHRTSKDRDLIKSSENEYSIEMILEDEYYGSETILKCSYSRETNNKAAIRELFQDGIKINKIREYMGICNTVTFAPEDINIIKGLPTNRRKFLNLMISKVSPSYIDLLSSANKLIAQKNITLKSFEGDISKIDNSLLDFWDLSIADISSGIILERLRFLMILNDKAKSHHNSISNSSEELSITYNTIGGSISLVMDYLNDNDIVCNFMSGTLSGANYSEIRHILSNYVYDKLVVSRKNDVIRGISSIGINKDDISFMLNEKDIKIFASQGQTRTAALSLKLSELEIIREISSSSPILLLDDVFSELDASRRNKLLSDISCSQMFITCTDKSFIDKDYLKVIENNTEIRFYSVENANIEQDSIL